eukprot:TRINITY_DN70832_c0_g1_i1.p1 TRINITY_DN70832_c0_g1~~TRINITY_DN70832_c0_g1_i1.p1  ORF type:complete len:780 (-),score=139.29 TRINITY_DN70832_c0_g1_i1:138-2477(-)
MGRGLLYRGTEEIFNSLKTSSHFAGEFVVYLSASLMHKKRAVDLLEIPLSSAEAYKTIKGPERLSKVALQDAFDLTNVIKRVYKQLSRMGPEWGEGDIEEKAHIVLTIEIMRRESNDIEEVLDEEDNLKPYAKVRIIKLCGSEYAGSSTKLSESQKSFATSSFNALSNQILQSALHTKTKFKGKKDMIPKGTEVLLKFLRETVGPENRVLVLTCINPRLNRLEDTLPALKFVSRMRECICQEIEKRGIQPFNPDSEHNVVPERKSKLESLREEINTICDNRTRRAKMSKEDLEYWTEQKEREVKALLAKLEDEMSKSPTKEESGLIEKYEELLLLKNKLGQIRKEQITPPRFSPILRKSLEGKPSPIHEFAHRKSSIEEHYSPEDLLDKSKGSVQSRRFEDILERNITTEEELKGKNEVNEKKIRELEEQIGELRNHARASDAYFERMTKLKTGEEESDTVTKLVVENERLKEKLRDMEEDQEYTSDKLNEYKRELQETKNELEKVKSRRRFQESERKKTVLELEKKQCEEIDALKAQVSSMKKVIEENRGALEKTKKDRERMTREVQELEQAHAKALKRKNEEMEEMRQALTEKIKVLQEELGKTQDRSQYEVSEEAERYREENRRLKEENIELMDKSSNYKEDNDKLRYELAMANKTNEKELAAIEQKCETLFTELQRLRVENAEYKERERVQIRKKDELLEKFKVVEEENRGFREKKKRYKKELAELEKRIKELEFEREMACKAVRRKGEVNLEAKEHQIKVMIMNSNNNTRIWRR